MATKATENKLDILCKFQRKIDPTPLDTGNFALNAVLGNGLHRSTFIEIASMSGIGKSTLAMSVCRSLCAQGKKVLYIDIEGGLEDPRGYTDDSYKKGNLLYDMGMEPYLESGNFILLNSNIESINDIYSVVEAVGGTRDKNGNFVESDFALIVIDSIAAIGGKGDRDKDGNIENTQMAYHAANIHKLLKALITFKASGLSVILINQLREDIGSIYAKSHSTGGTATKYYPDIRLGLRKVEDIKDSTTGMIGGAWVEVIADKNRIAQGKLPYYIPIIYGKGLSQIFTAELAMKTKHIINYNGESVPMYQDSGSWKTLTLGNKKEDVYKSQKADELRAIIKENYNRIISEGLLTQEDFQIKVNLGTITGGDYE